MSRKTPTTSTLRALFAYSGNLCAFPGCSHPLVNEHGVFIAQVCHIRAAAEGGPRYDMSQSDEGRRSLANLLVLCHRHHVETDDVKVYTVDRLVNMKHEHETEQRERLYRIDESLLHKLAHEMDEFWDRLELAKAAHIVPELAVQLDEGASYAALYHEAIEIIENINALAAAATGPFEVKHLGLPNTATRLNALSLLMAAKHFELHLAHHPEDGLVRQYLERTKAELLVLAGSGGLVD